MSILEFSVIMYDAFPNSLRSLVLQRSRPQKIKKNNNDLIQIIPKCKNDFTMNFIQRKWSKQKEFSKHKNDTDKVSETTPRNK